MILRKNLEIKEVSPEGVVKAVIATLNVVDKDGDVTLPGAFGEQEVVMLPSHDWRHIPLGKGVLREEGDQAVAHIQMNLAVQAAKEWHSALKFDLEKGRPLQQWSYGFNILPGGQEEGEMGGRRVRYLRPRPDKSPGLLVHEVSPVLVGAGEGTGTVDVKGAKGAIGSHETEVVDLDWDGAEAVRRAREGEGASYYGRIFAWKDPEGEPGNKTSYKFPHHEVSADGDPGPANLKALAAAIGALNGARGGAAIPEADRRGVYAHLAKHMKDGGAEPPPLKAQEPDEGKRFCDEAEAAIEAVEALSQRASSLADLRAKEGRDISPVNRERLAKLARALGAAAEAVGAVLAPTPPQQALKELLRYEKIAAGAHGGKQR